MDRYVAAAENKAYMEAAFKKAKVYFEGHQGEWFMLCAKTPEDMLPMVYYVGDGDTMMVAI
jgi:hypothetical protein